MTTAGIDVGAQTVKVVLLNQDKIASYSVLKAAFDLEGTCAQAFKEALEKSKLSMSDISRIVATGTGRKEIKNAQDSISVISADAKGVVFLYPKARTIVDIGFEEAWGIRCDSAGRVTDYSKNEKCAAGVVAFVETMARALELKTEDMGPLSMQSNRDISLNFTCAVFAESEVVSLIHAKTPKPDIARAIHESVAIRVTSMVRRIASGIEPEVIFIGGMAKNIGVAEGLKHHLGIDMTIPDEPQIVAALGAALAARGEGGSK